MRITGRQRKLLSDLSQICNELGSPLDGTATNNVKYIDRQRALMLVSHVVYGVLCDEQNNEYREEDFELALKSMETLKKLNARIYPDKNGIINQFEF